VFVLTVRSATLAQYASLLVFVLTARSLASHFFFSFFFCIRRNLTRSLRTPKQRHHNEKAHHANKHLKNKPNRHPERSITRPHNDVDNAGHFEHEHEHTIEGNGYDSGQIIQVTYEYHRLSFVSIPNPMRTETMKSIGNQRYEVGSVVD